MPNLLRSKDGKPRVLLRQPGCKHFHVMRRFILRFDFHYLLNFLLFYFVK